ncbi:MAG: DUF4215 domain-containing protein, partial [Candidatus Magasanikbacteria bacterium]|nr:DUF4215 domain-containing protein [Candidatus Magasanikbacteria bacterium]
MRAGNNTFIDTGLTNDTLYWYTIFIRDTSQNVSAGVSASVTPVVAGDRDHDGVTDDDDFCDGNNTSQTDTPPGTIVDPVNGCPLVAIDTTAAFVRPTGIYGFPGVRRRTDRLLAPRIFYSNSRTPVQPAGKFRLGLYAGDWFIGAPNNTAIKISVTADGRITWPPEFNSLLQVSYDATGAQVAATGYPLTIDAATVDPKNTLRLLAFSAPSATMGDRVDARLLPGIYNLAYYNSARFFVSPNGVISWPAHFNNLFRYDPEQRLLKIMAIPVCIDPATTRASYRLITRQGVTPFVRGRTTYGLLPAYPVNIAATPFNINDVQPYVFNPALPYLERLDIRRQYLNFAARFEPTRVVDPTDLEGGDSIVVNAGRAQSMRLSLGVCGSQSSLCGNRILDLGEQCDDGNTRSGDGCSSLCHREAPPTVCGNGILEAGELCDDGNIIENDGCSLACTIPARPAATCGNGVVETGEQCDDANITAGDGCSTVCGLENRAAADLVTGEQLILSLQRRNASSQNTSTVDQLIAAINTGRDALDAATTAIRLREENSITPLTTSSPENAANNPETPAGQNSVATNTASDLESAAGPVAEAFSGAPESGIANDISDRVNNIITKLPASVKNAAQTAIVAMSKLATTVQEIAANEEVKKTAKRVVAPVSVGTATIAMSSTLWDSIVPLLRLVFLQPILALGLRRREAWGVVYNSLNKLPVDLALVRLVHVETNRLVQTRVTDRFGRYIFMANPGMYRLEIQKSGFVFPSHVLRGVYTDGRKLELYHGDTIPVGEGDGLVTPNIPVDPAAVEKTPHRLVWERYLRGTQNVVASVGLFTTGASLLIAPAWTTETFFLAQITLIVIFRRIVKRGTTAMRWGRIVDAETKKPIGNAIVRLFTAEYNHLVD